MKMLKVLEKLLLVIAILFVGFLGGSALANIPPEVIYEPYPVEVEVIKVEYVPEYIIQKEYIIKEIPQRIIREVPREIKEFESLQELKQFLKDDDTDEILILYPIRETGSVICLRGVCDHYALNLQRRALEAGYLMSTQMIEKDNEEHMINSATIGNEIYYIEPQTDEVWLWGYRQLVR